MLPPLNPGGWTPILVEPRVGGENENVTETKQLSTSTMYKITFARAWARGYLRASFLLLGRIPVSVERLPVRGGEKLWGTRGGGRDDRSCARCCFFLFSEQAHVFGLSDSLQGRLSAEVIIQQEGAQETSTKGRSALAIGIANQFIKYKWQAR